MITVAILAKNEEDVITQAISSVKGLGPVVVADDGSTDQTVKLAKAAGAKVLTLPDVTSFAAKRNWLMGQISTDWVFFLDADEQLSPGGLQEILKAIQSADHTAYALVRQDHFLGRSMHHGDNVTRVIRLMKRGSGTWEGAVHERWRSNTSAGSLQRPLLHFPHPQIYEFLRGINHYSSLRAQELQAAGHQGSLFEIILYPTAKFCWLYFAKLGFLDAFPGAVSALMMSFYSFLVRAKLWLLQHPGETLSSY